MGNSEYRQELRQYLPQMHNYTLTHCYSPLSIYRHLYNAEEIMEFRERVMNTQDVDRKVQTFLARYQHIYLVSSLFMKVEGSNNCGNVEYDLSIYYERVVTNLSKINEISFKDSLHCLAVALKGFEILYKNYGHFEIFENMFHICQRGRLKVWCNQNIYKNVPEQYLLGQGREEDMVVKIVNIIDQNTDESCKVFPIRQAIIGLKKVSFSNAIVALRQICRENNFNISEHLESLENFSQFQSLLDIYSPPKRFPKDTLVTFYPKNGKSGRGTHRSNSNSNSSKTGQKAQPSERGKSAEATVNHNRRFNLTIAHEENEFPKFMAGRGRQKNYSRSSSSQDKSGKSGTKPTAFKAYTQAQPVLVPHSHLQQFSKINGESQLRKRNILQEPHQQNIRYNQQPQQRFVQQALQKQVVYFPQEQRFTNSPQVYTTQALIQRPMTPQQMQRQTSAPVFVPHQLPNMQLEHSIVQPHPEYLSQQQINTRYAMPIDQQQVHRNNNALAPNTVMSPSQIIRNQQGKPVEVQQKPVNIVFNRQPQQVYNNFEKRCISVPIKMSYQGSNLREVAFSPNKQSPSVQSKFTTSPIKPQPYNKKERLVTLGEISISPTKNQDMKPYLAKHERRDDKFHLPQLQSKIQLLQSFADNKITTQQFLPNQSHALSNIKWQKSSNSGRDSVTSAFRKDILLESNPKPSEKKGEEWRKDESLLRKDMYKNGSKIEEGGFYTNQKLLELIKTGHKSKPYEYPKSTYQQKMKRYEKYGRQDCVKEPTTKQSQPSDYYNDLYYKPTPKYTTNPLFGQQSISTPTFGLSDKQPLKKKDPYLNKITSITQKWQQENICSTSNGSRGGGGGLNIHSSNIDEDILQDMHNEGFGMLFKKK